MANALFQQFKAKQLGDAGTTTITVVDFEATAQVCSLCTSQGGIVDPLTNKAITEIFTKEPAYAGSYTYQTLASKTVSYAAGTVTVDADNVTFTSVSGSQVTSVVLWQNTTNSTTSALTVFFDTATGLPVTPNGGNIVVQWNASGIFTW